MVRAAKKTQRNKDSSKFKDAVDASTKLDGTGVVHEDGQAFYKEKLSSSDRAAVGEELAELLVEIAEREQEARDSAGTFRNELKDMREKRDSLRDQYLSGMRKRPAQEKLPGTEARG